ncbi:MAG: hypothetical protein DDT26_02692 [Dehalococcoidia bacterium]|nr:hypothetical protein [Chloroflexota bacterium]
MTIETKAIRYHLHPVGMDGCTAMRAGSQGILHMLGVRGHIRQPIPIEFAIRPHQQEAKGIPVAKPVPVRVEEDDIPVFGACLLRSHGFRSHPCRHRTAHCNYAHSNQADG